MWCFVKLSELVNQEMVRVGLISEKAVNIQRKSWVIVLQSTLKYEKFACWKQKTFAQYTVNAQMN